MKSYAASEIRNIAVLGHNGSGKTSLTEAALFNAGLTQRLGKIEDGSTVSDFDPEEIKRKASINTSLIPIEWNNLKINFLDTPGYFDFEGEVQQALAAADLALIVVSAKSGVEVGAIKAWEFAEKAGIPKMIFVNSMDDENADLDRTIENLRDRFGKSIAPLQLAYTENDRFVGFVNVIRKEARMIKNGKSEGFDFPTELEEPVMALRGIISEAVAETDDELMEKFFAEEIFTAEEIEEGIKKGLLEKSVTPVVCGSATLNIGIRSLLDNITMFTPSTLMLHPSKKGEDAKGNEAERACDENAPFSAYVFKTIADPYVGRLNIFKVISGTLKKDSVVYNSQKDITEKISHLIVMRGKEQIPVQELKAGDIGAVAKLQATGTNDTLCDKANPISFGKIDIPKAYTARAIAPKGKGDEDKLSQALAKILEEDCVLKFKIDKDTKQSVVYGMGDQHLDVFVNKLKNKYKIEVDLTVPITPYKEMIKGKSKVQGKYKKQSGGHGQYGDVWMEFEPSGDLTVPFVFEEKIFGGSVPKQYFPAVEKGLQESIKSGVLAGYPVVGLKAILVDGSYHPVDSSEMAFKMAASTAFKEGLPKAKPTILEPIVKLEIIVPDEYTGDIMGDINKKRGKILGMSPLDGKQKIEAEAPQSEVYNYSTDLRSMTQSRGVYTMEFSRYEEAPADVQQKIISESKNANH